MTNFETKNTATKILSDELEKKIEEVNASMVEARDKAEKFQGIKNKLDGEIKDMEEMKKKLEEEISLLEQKKIALLLDFDELKKELDVNKAELENVNNELAEAKIANKEESKKSIAEREEIKIRKSDLDGQESVLRTYSKGLEDKEKKLDVYADRVKKLLDSVKPE